MSSFMVNDNVINSIVSSLFNDRNNYGWLKRKYGLVNPAILGNRLFLMNKHAVDNRYGKGAAAKFRDLDYKYKLVLPVNTIELYTLLDTLHYQCSGNSVGHTLEYRFLDDFYNYVAHAIAREVSSK